MNIHQAIRAAMAWEGVTITDLSKQVGIDRHTLGKRLSGRADFTATEIKDIAEALGLKPSELWRRAEEAKEGTKP